jgi:hypothetical protein
VFADAGLRQMDHIGRAGKAVRLRHRLKDPQLIQVNQCIIVINIIKTIHLTHVNKSPRIGTGKEDVMSNLKYKPVEFEEACQREGAVDRIQTSQQRLGPFLVADNHDRSGGSAVGRESEILDYVLARGSMPA